MKQTNKKFLFISALVITGGVYAQTNDYSTGTNVFCGSGSSNLVVGVNAGSNSMTGSNNTLLGVSATQAITSGSKNTCIGFGAGANSITSGLSNTYLGYEAGINSGTGSANTILGCGAGTYAQGSSNIFIGSSAGAYSSATSINNKLYIDVSNTSSPLIGGDFSARTAAINGALSVNSTGAIPLTITGASSNLKFYGNSFGDFASSVNMRPHFASGTDFTVWEGTTITGSDIMRLSIAGTTGATTINGALTVNSTIIADGAGASSKVILGSANSAALNYGTSFVGLNAFRDPSSGNWTAYSDGAHNGASIMFGDLGGNFNFSSMPTTTSGSSNASYTDAQVMTNVVMKIGGGQVFIGTQKPTWQNPQAGALLNVSGNVLVGNSAGTAGLYINQTNWADFVFDKNYKLMPLAEVESFYTKNNHLPNVPTTKEIQEKGNNVGETEVLLLQKVEELTLYVVEQNKKIEQQQKEIEALKVRK